MTDWSNEGESPEFRAIVRALDDRLADIARDVIAGHLDLSDDSNRRFHEAPDDREQHQMQWHQWGILTHTRVFLQHFYTDIPRYLRLWGLWDDVDRILRQEIDGVSRWQLLQISILLHDLGKFAARKRGRERFHFGGHERLSGSIIRKELGLSSLGLTPRQIEYVARTAEDHFVLGLLRREARQHGAYDLQFVVGDEFSRLVERIKTEHPDDYIEVGVLFLGDSLAKADPVAGPRPAVSQYEINLEVAHRYLCLVLGRGSL